MRGVWNDVGVPEIFGAEDARRGSENLVKFDQNDLFGDGGEGV